MTLEQIQNLTLNESFVEVLDGLIDFSQTPKGERSYWFFENEGSNYDRLELNKIFTKPSLKEMEAEFEIYKSKLTAKEEVRLIEKTRQNDLKYRFKTLKDRDAGLPAFYQIIKNTSNPAVYFTQSILKESNHSLAESRLKAIEDADKVLRAASDAIAYIAKRKAEYPSIEELIVALWEGDQNKINELEATRQVVKAKYPK